jgi:hypothetical protein
MITGNLDLKRVLASPGETRWAPGGHTEAQCLAHAEADAPCASEGPSHRSRGERRWDHNAAFLSVLLGAFNYFNLLASKLACY